MNLSEIRDLIRAEANIQGLEEYTNLIDNLINQELQRLTGLAPYEALWTSTNLPWLADAQFEFDLPANFQLLDRIIYTPNVSNPRSYGNPYTLDKGFARGTLTSRNGRPQYYHRAGAKLRIYPYLDSYMGDSIDLAYYKKPELLLDSDLFPVESLVLPVQQFVMSRMLAMTDTKKAVFARQNANQAVIAARAENAGN